MTVFAGAFSLKKNRGIPLEMKGALSENLCTGNRDNGRRSVHDSVRIFLARWDSGAYAEPAWRDDPDGSICTLAGDPLLLQEDQRLCRDSQMAQIAPSGNPLSENALSHCRGSFALAHYVATTETLYLSTDAIGLRSIYYTVQDDLLIFSTALRVLEAITQVKKKLSLLGMAENAAFSFPLAERTPYEGISVLREAEILITRSGGVDLRSYYDWATAEPIADNPTQAAAQIFATFQEAIRIRAGSDKRVYSFLSGGMDSRAIVATLIGLGRHVEALNFSAEHSQDQRYAQSFAQLASEKCTLHCLPGGIYPNFSFLALAAKSKLERKNGTSVDRPSFIWSGDGGSVGLGHVYMDEPMLEHADRGDVQAAIRHFFDFNRIGLPTGVLTASARKRLPAMLFNSVLDEVNRYPRTDVGRRIYLFLLFNDQRRHLFKHFETIDQHGLELLTPFYDTRFLAAVAATPSRWGILHRLYSQFFQHLPAFALKTPWQTYPGHVPCPLPHDERATYQWTGELKSRRESFEDRCKTARELLSTFNPKMRPQVFSPFRIKTATLIHALGLRDCNHILPTLQSYQRHDAICHT